MAAYIIMGLFNGTTAPTRTDLLNERTYIYKEFTYTISSNEHIQRFEGLGYPYNMVISTRLCVSRFKIAYYYTPSVVPQSNTRLTMVIAALKGGTSSQYPAFTSLQFTDDEPASSAQQFSCNTDSGLVDSATGLPIYYYTGGATGSSTTSVSLWGTPIYSDLNSALAAMNDGNWSYIISEDPYSQGGFSDVGGGGGNFDDTSDPVDFPPLPTWSVCDSGFVKIYNPTITQIRNLAGYMWTNPLFDMSNWKSIIAQPMDCILSLARLPVPIPNGGSETIEVGNISTDVTMIKAGSQFVEVDCGSLSVDEYWGSYLDYAPYTKISIYLPYIGVRDLDIDECMSTTLHLKYQVDIFTGACTAYIKCGNAVLYEFNGNCAFNIPISAANYNNTISSIISTVGSVAATIATDGMTAPLAIGATASAVSTVANSKPNIAHGGNLAGNLGALAVQIPFIIIHRPNQAVPTNQNYYVGYPSYITMQLQKASGYCEIESIHFSDFAGTDEEKQEVIELLKSGVII